MKTFMKAFAAILLLLLSFVVRTYHAGTAPRPVGFTEDPLAQHEWIDKSQSGIHQLILHGDDYNRGLWSGRLTQNLLERQEDELIHQLKNWVPSDVALQIMVLGGALWFQGVDRYFEPSMLQEMWGVSQSASGKYWYLSDGYTRQIAYHGLHEVGQMMVDQGFEGMGCTVVGMKWQDSWVIGRNFDFEGGRIFDSEKIMKWVFPDKGHSYLSVIWAGMVGAVTGVNDQGLYVSINAAGSSDFQRIGTPSTLLTTKVLQEANNLDEAIQIFQQSQMFITDIFVVFDSKAGRLVRIEKSPKRMQVIPATDTVVVANHLIGSVWQNDSTNQYRREHLTSEFREQRGQELIQHLAQQARSKTLNKQQVQDGILAILRDKGHGEMQAPGEHLHLGNRRAIDALIATHSVVFNGHDQNLYVSKGPGLVGEFVGFDLAKSFAAKKPVVIENLKHDTQLTDQEFIQVRKKNRGIAIAAGEIGRGNCDQGISLLQQLPTEPEQSTFYIALGKAYECQGQMAKAKEYYSKALSLYPAYKQQIEFLQAKVK